MYVHAYYCFFIRCKQVMEVSSFPLVLSASPSKVCLTDCGVQIFNTYIRMHLNSTCVCVYAQYMCILLMVCFLGGFLLAWQMGCMYVIINACAGTCTCTCMSLWCTLCLCSSQPQFGSTCNFRVLYPTWLVYLKHNPHNVLSSCHISTLKFYRGHSKQSSCSSFSQTMFARYFGLVHVLGFEL